MLRADADGAFLSLQARIIELFDEHRESIVRVKAAHQNTSEEGKERVSLLYGTGFYISREGHVLTNASVAYGADRVWVIHEGVEYAAEMIGHDPENKVTLLRTLRVPQQFSFMHLGSGATLQPVGTMVLRISSPLEFSPSPFTGVVSGHESSFGQIGFPTTYLRTTLPAGPGEVGSPLLDLNGNFVGMTLGSISDMPSTSYVLPARAVVRIRDDLLFSGEVTYGWAGFDVQERISSENGRTIFITEILPGTPAERAGLLPDDVIAQIGDTQVRTRNDVRDALFFTRPGQIIPIKGSRDGEPLDLSLRIAERPIDIFMNRPTRPVANTDTEEGSEDTSVLPEPDSQEIEEEQVVDSSEQLPEQVSQDNDAFISAENESEPISGTESVGTEDATDGDLPAGDEPSEPESEQETADETSREPYMDDDLQEDLIVDLQGAN